MLSNATRSTARHRISHHLKCLSTPNPLIFNSTRSSFCSQTEANPLLQKNPRDLPAYGTVKPDHVRSAMANLLLDFDEHVEQLLNQVKSKQYPSVASFTNAFEDVSRDVSYSWSMVGHLIGVKNSEELRKVYEEFEPLVVRKFVQLGQSTDVYNQWLEYSQNNTLDKIDQRVVDLNLQQAKLSGVGLDGKAKARFNQVVEELAQLSNQFQNNVLDANKAYGLLLHNKSDVEHLPVSLLGFTSQNAKLHEGNKEDLIHVGSKTTELKDSTPENGPWLITLDFPSFMPFMQHCTNSELRRQLFEAYARRASELQTYGSSEQIEKGNNMPVIEKILQLRGEQCKLLDGEFGSNYAQLSVSKKMAPSTEKIQELLDQLRVKALPKALEEVKELKLRAAQDNVTDVNRWDISFYSERIKEEKYGISDEVLRQYFPFNRVLQGMFSVASNLFSVRIEKASDMAESKEWQWDSHVEYYKVYDEATNQQIAGFFLDPYSRPQEKRGGAWMDVSVSKSNIHDTLPIANLVCNQMPPVGDGDSYMTWTEVLTLFHEFGHGLQHMLTTAKYEFVSGISGVEWDAVELPSQFMENWCYLRKNIDLMTEHEETKETLPDDLYQKLLDSRNHMAGWMLMRQLHFAELDLELHKKLATVDDATITKEKIEQVVATVGEKYAVLPRDVNDRTLNSFAHIFAGGYAAGYYSYLWAEVLSSDAFAAFEEVGLDNEAKVKETGMRFRETVLQSGGAVHPMDVYHAFRGRDPSPEALLRHRGIE